MKNRTSLWAMCCILLCSILLTAVARQAAAASVSGVVEPLVDVTLSLPVEGIVSKVACHEGQRVTSGAVLVQLENRAEQIEVARRRLVWQSDSELRSARTREKTLKKILESNSQLYEKTRAVSREELDKLTLQWNKAAAEKELLAVQEEREELEYKLALRKLEQRTLKAPVGGVIEKVWLDEGEICQPGQELVRLVNARECYLVAHVPEAQGCRLKRGRKVEMQIRTGGRLVAVTGVIDLISQVVDPASGLMRVKVLFENRNGTIRPGLTGMLVLSGPEHRSN